MNVRVKHHDGARFSVPSEGPLGDPIVKKILGWAGFAVLCLGGLLLGF